MQEFETKKWKDLWEEFLETGGWHKEFYSWVKKNYPKINIR